MQKWCFRRVLSEPIVSINESPEMDIRPSVFSILVKSNNGPLCCLIYFKLAFMPLGVRDNVPNWTNQDTPQSSDMAPMITPMRAL
jgi:hypothetical protein